MTFKEFVLSFPLSAAPQVLCYDDEGTDAGTAVVDDVAADDSGDVGQSSSTEPEKKFTQEDLNRILAEDRRKHEAATKTVQEQAKNMEKRLQKLIADKNTSDAQRATLEADLEDLRASQRSEQEQREHLAKKAKEAHENEINNLKSEASQWESLFKQSTIERTLLDAGIKHDAFDPEQIVVHLQSKTEMKAVKDTDGNVIPGRFEPKTAVEVKEESGEVLTAWKSPDEAVELMKNNPDKYGNLFRNAVIAGIGGGTAATTGKNSAGVDPSKLSIAEKARRFQEDPESLGLKPRQNY